MMLRRSDLCSLVIALSIAGYPLVASLATVLGIPNPVLSIGMRGFVAGSSLLLVTLATFRQRQHNVLALALVCILLLYGARLAEQTLFRPQSLGGSDYWIWYGGVTMLPVLAVMLTPNIDWRRVQVLLLLMLTVAGLLIVLQGSVTAESDGMLVDTGRVSLTTLNPISVGYVGVALVLLGMWEIFGNHTRLKNATLVFLGVTLLGLYLVFISASRGPALSLSLTLLVVALSLRGSRKLRFLGGGGLLIFAAGALFLNSEVAENVRFVTRLASIIVDFDSDASNTTRLSLFQTSIQQIQEHPALGSSIENSVYRWAPHNIILEFILATGILGGALLTLILGILLFMVAQFVRERHAISGIALIFIASATGAQFSGNVYQNSSLWITAMAIAVCTLKERRNRYFENYTPPTS